jgi:hypothetical protein
MPSATFLRKSARPSPRSADAFLLGFGADRLVGGFRFGVLGPLDQQRRAFVRRRGEQVLRRHDARHRVHDLLVEGHVGDLDVADDVAPRRDHLVEVLLGVIDDLGAHAEDVGLLGRRDELPDRAVDRPLQRELELLRVAKLKRLLDLSSSALATA